MLVGSMMTASVGCFPHNARNRTIAEIVEGGVAVSGVVVEALTQTGADCQTTSAPGEPKMMCQDNASLGSGVGVALILAGLVGFIATISSSEDDTDAQKPVIIKAANPAQDPPAAPISPVPLSGTGSAGTPPASEPTPPAPAPTPAPATN